LETLGSVGGITPRVLDAVRGREKARFAEMRRPLMAVMVGGDTKRGKVSEAQWRAFADDLAQMSKSVGMVVTPSRRTPAHALTILREALPEAWIWDGEGDNPYLGMLACADCVLVTDDSINMASEAAASGSPLAIYPLVGEGGKIARFHKAMIERGHAEWFGGVPTASAGPLDETGRAAEAVAALIGSGA
jgi:mitochondrial fission protein ELM1